jgi:hypothetical protein
MAAPIAPVASPPHLLRRKAIDIVLRCDRRLRTFARLGSRPLTFRRNRRQWCCLGTDGARSQRGRARDKSKGEFQKVAAFHHIPPLQIISEAMSFAAPR